MKAHLGFLCLLFIIFYEAQAQSYRELISQAEVAYNSKDFVKSAELYARAFRIEKKSFVDLYNAACSEALRGNKEQAYQYLEASIRNGWSNLQHFKSDTDLASLHGSKQWDNLVTQLAKSIEKLEAAYDKPLQKELLQILREDQETRKIFVEVAKIHGYQHPKTDSLGRMIHRKDSINLLKIKKILDERGWVGKEVVGPEASQTLFLVIQHSDYETQKKYLPMLRDAVKKGNAGPASLALLEDRVAIREGRKQRYGSQIGIIPNTNEHYVLPLEDPDNVDKRRMEMGLAPMAVYLSNWELNWNVEEYKKNLPEYEKLAAQQMTK
jgi:tetratricopeptide (TPR) repeat protein